MYFKLYSLIVMIVMMIMLMIIFLSMIINDAEVSDDDDGDVDCIWLVDCNGWCDSGDNNDRIASSLFRIKSQALKIYRSELNLPTSKDLGLHGTTRAALRTLCKTGTLSYSSS